MDDKALEEKAAEVQHDIWAHWMQWFFENDTPKNRERWVRQMFAVYGDLSESERESDRRVVRQFVMPLLREVAEEASREELDFALRAAQSRELRVKALEAEVKRQSLAAGELEAEVERLKVERDEAWSAANSAEAEVEQLKKLNHDVVQDEIEWRNKAAQAGTEVERLGGILAHETSRSYAERDAALAKLEAVEATLTVCELDRLDAHEAKEAAEAEVERLRAALDALVIVNGREIGFRSLHGIPMKMAAKIEKKVRAALRGEGEKP
jgi:chromosome segregation ATPase